MMSPREKPLQAPVMCPSRGFRRLSCDGFTKLLAPIA